MTNNTHPGVGRCKHIIRHDAASLAQLGIDPTQEPAEGAGPCLFKTWGLIPADAAKVVLTMEGEQLLCLREIGSTVYQYCPTGEATAGLEPGLFATLPITGIALIQHEDGSVHEKARAKLLARCERNGEMALPFYEMDR